jgi:hypothetical protein
MVNIIAPPMKDKRVIVIPTSVSASMIILNTAAAINMPRQKQLELIRCSENLFFLEIIAPTMMFHLQKQ